MATHSDRRCVPADALSCIGLQRPRWSARNRAFAAGGLHVHTSDGSRAALTGILPLELRPSQTCELNRLGGSGDGGYLINKRDVASSRGLISLGIDRNWSFERQFRRLNPIPVHAYDGCTSVGYLLQETRRALSVRHWRWLARSLLSVADYRWFFSGRDVRHFQKFVGTGDYAYQASSAPLVGLFQVFNAMIETGASETCSSRSTSREPSI